MRREAELRRNRLRWNLRTISSASNWCKFGEDMVEAHLRKLGSLWGTSVLYRIIQLPMLIPVRHAILTRLNSDWECHNKPMLERCHTRAQRGGLILAGTTAVFTAVGLPRFTTVRNTSLLVFLLSESGDLLLECR